MHENDSERLILSTYPQDIQALNVEHSKIKFVDTLEPFTRLRSVSLRRNRINNLEFIRHKNHCIEEFDMYDNRLVEADEVNNLKKAKYVDLSFNNLKDMISFTTDQLTELYLANNLIRTIDGLNSLTNLRVLELGSNKITEIKGLDMLVNLEELWLGKNKIRRLEGLENLKKLKKLSIQSNHLSKIEGLECLDQLEELYLSHNNITKIEGLTSLKNLKILDISNNNIQHLEGLDHLEHLEDLWMNSNNISSWLEVEKIKGLSLSTIYLEHNPIQDKFQTQYRLKIKLIFPGIKQIDATLTGSGGF